MSAALAAAQPSRRSESITAVDIEEKIRHYQRSIDRSLTDRDRLLYCIGQLSRLPVTVLHLEVTGVGRTVNALRKLEDGVGDAARILVSKWKDMVSNTRSSNDEDEACVPDAPESYESPDHDSESEAVVTQTSNNYDYNEPEALRRPAPSPPGELMISDDIESYDYAENTIVASTSDEKEESKEVRKNKSISSQSKQASKSATKSADEKSRKDKLSSSGSRSKQQSSKYHPESSKSKKEEKSKSKYESGSSTSSTPSNKDKKLNESKKRKNESNSDDDGSDAKRRKRSLSLADTSDEADEEESDKSNLVINDQESEEENRNNESEEEEEEDKEEKMLVDKESRKESSRKGTNHSDKSKSKDKHHVSSSHKSKSKESSDKLKKDEGRSSSKSHEREKEDSKESKAKGSHSSSSGKDQTKHKSKDKKKSKHSKDSSSKDRKSEKVKSVDKSIKDNKSKEPKESKDNKESGERKDRPKDKEQNKQKDLKDSKDSKKEAKKEKKGFEEDDGGIDSYSGTSFAEALGMFPMRPKAKKKKENSSFASPSSSSSFSLPKSTKSEQSNSGPSPSSSKNTPSIKIKSDPPESPESLPLLSSNVKLEPLSKISDAVDLAATLPEPSPNYRPLPQMNHHQRKLEEDQMLSQVIYAKNQRTKVYSGNKTGITHVPSLYEMCIRILIDNIEALEYTGGVPFFIIKPVLERATADQLFMLEHHNPYLMEETDSLWQFHCNKTFRTKKREEMESWREMYLRCLDEQEARLIAIKNNIKNSQDKSAPVRSTKIYEIVKPPRNVARQQAKYGTACMTAKISDLKKKLITASSGPSSSSSSGNSSGSSSGNSSSNSSNRVIDRISVPSAPPSVRARLVAPAIKKAKAPLMAKALQAIKGRYKR